MKPDISKDSEKFIVALLQLEENFGRLFSIERFLKRRLNEATIDISQIEKRINRYSDLFDTMLVTALTDQDWKFIDGYLKDALNEIDTYFEWISDIDKNDIQITKKEIDELIRFKRIVEQQLKKTQPFTND